MKQFGREADETVKLLTLHFTLSSIIYNVCVGAIAQLGEQPPDKRQDGGSIPLAI